MSKKKKQKPKPFPVKRETLTDWDYARGKYQSNLTGRKSWLLDEY